jgi:hypothetical protein
MIFDEQTHAYLVATIYRELRDTYGDKGIEIFNQGTKKQANQRGSRMRQRAAHHGFIEPDFPTYFAFGEWTPTSNSDFIVKESKRNVDLLTHVYACPWAKTFAKMGLIDCGLEYCKYIDKEIVRGFSQRLELEVNSLLHDSHYCDFVWHDVFRNPEKEEKLLRYKQQHNVDPTMPFSYHCAHIYHTYKMESIAVFGDPCSEVFERVLSSFKEEYGDNMTSVILSYEGHDFNTPVDMSAYNE